MNADILILDDEPVVCERLKAHLEKSDYSVETFTDSQAAIDRLAEKRFDVVVTDLKMKGPTGLDVLHFVRQKATATEVIMITGFASMETAREAEYSGVFDFITKPFKVDDIASLVHKAVRKAQKARRADR